MIGADAELHVSQKQLELNPGDKVVVASDGVSDNVSLEELLDIVRSSQSPEQASDTIKKLIDEHLELGLAPQITGSRYRHDDQTAIIRFF